MYLYMINSGKQCFNRAALQTPPPSPMRKFSYPLRGGATSPGNHYLLSSSNIPVCIMQTVFQSSSNPTNQLFLRGHSVMCERASCFLELYFIITPPSTRITSLVFTLRIPATCYSKSCVHRHFRIYRVCCVDHALVLLLRLEFRNTILHCLVAGHGKQGLCFLWIVSIHSLNYFSPYWENSLFLVKKRHKWEIKCYDILEYVSVGTDDYPTLFKFILSVSFYTPHARDFGLAIA